MKNIKILFGLFSIIIIILLYIFIFVFYQPFGNEITQDRLFVKLLCGTQYNCDAVIGPYSCGGKSGIANENDLIKWKNYRGCNESTSGYDADDFGNEWINLEYCSCGGFVI